MNTDKFDLDRLRQIIKELRDTNGCPWDKKQTTASLTKYLHEEFNEIIVAINNNDTDNLCEELGDFLYLILMIAEINEEHDHFTIDDVIYQVCHKLIRRHPHVFTNRAELDEAELRKQWESIKKAEKENKSS